MKVIGAWSGHDCSFCVLEDGHPVVHAEYERYIREKEPAGDSLKFMFEHYKDVDDIKHFATTHSISKLHQYPESLSKLQSIIDKNNGSMFIIGHHQAHAANAGPYALRG